MVKDMIDAEIAELRAELRESMSSFSEQVKCSIDWNGKVHIPPEMREYLGVDESGKVIITIGNGDDKCIKIMKEEE